MIVNGLACKDPKTVTADDFFFSGLDVPGNTSNPVGSAYAFVTTSQLAGLNTLGLSLVRADYAPSGITPPHIHPRATEVVTVLEGTLEVGFVTSLPDNHYFTKVLGKGDVFAVPPGLIHVLRNPGKTNAVAIAFFNSQSPGVSMVPRAVFGSTPGIPADLLAKAFLVDRSIITQIQSKFQKK